MTSLKNQLAPLPCVWPLSMIDGILEGDFVIASAGSLQKTRDIVVALWWNC